MEITIVRNLDNRVQTLGNLYIDEDGVVLFGCKTLELSNKGNQPRISCIPKGIYSVKKRLSPSLGKCLHILDVPNRSFILIHSGNFYTQILGCCLVGDSYKDVNGDGHLDILNSKKTLQKILNILPDFCVLTIK